MPMSLPLYERLFAALPSAFPTATQLWEDKEIHPGTKRPAD